MLIFRGLRFKLDEEIGPFGIFEMAYRKFQPSPIMVSKSIPAQTTPDI